MNNKVIYLGIFIFLIMFWNAIIFIAKTDKSYAMREQCSIASFHPDITSEMRKKCRELLWHKL
jgi:hypothetical protein